MTEYVVLLRGINVSGQKKIKMADLRTWLEKAGFAQVRTYIQSGNIVLQSSLTETEVSAAVHACLQDQTGWEIPVCVRSANEWKTLPTRLPFPEAAEETPQYVGVVFFHSLPPKNPVANVDAESFLPERFEHDNRELFLHLPNGFGRTKLTNNFWEKQAGTAATSRNWKTVLALEKMTT